MTSDLPVPPGTSKFVVICGSTLESSDTTLAGAREHAARVCRSWAHPPVITQLLVMPDGGFRISSPWSGGTWGGRCGSTLWVPDPDFTLAFRQVTPGNSRVRMTQAWHEHWVLNDLPRYFQPEARADRAYGGFRIECDGKYRHDGKCYTGYWHWSSRPHPDGMENVFRRAGRLQQRLALV